MKIRVMLVEDHLLFRKALRVMLENDGGIEVIAELGDGQELLQCYGQIAPDIVCMDVNLPDTNGIEMTRQLLGLDPQSKVIGLSAYTERYFIREMFDAGASGYVSKSSAGEYMARAIHSVHEGNIYACPATVAALYNSEGKNIKFAISLNKREQQMLELIADGNSETQIADRLQIALSTLHVHRRNILRKLSLPNIDELTKFATLHRVAKNKMSNGAVANNLNV